MHTALAFDFGLARIGVAVGNSLLRQAQPLGVILAEAEAQRFAGIADYINTWQPEVLVVGIPYYPDGQAHDMTKRCQRFARQLEGRFGVGAGHSRKVCCVDERYTSAVLDPSRPGEHQDHLAAAVILEQYWQTLSAEDGSDANP